MSTWSGEPRAVCPLPLRARDALYVAAVLILRGRDLSRLQHEHNRVQSLAKSVMQFSSHAAALFADNAFAQHRLPTLDRGNICKHQHSARLLFGRRQLARS